MKFIVRTALAWASACALGTCLAAGPGAEEFSWRARLNLPAGASAVRVDLPADALMRLQSADARDLRVFNASGEAVPITWPASLAVSAPPSAFTASYGAFPLMKSSAARPKGAAAVSVQIDGAGARQSVWVRMDGHGGASASAQESTLPSAIFDLRQEKQTLSAISAQADLPPNQPVLVTASSSTDLAQWTPLNLRGRLYRFEGPGAPSNLRLEMDAAQSLQGRYLRLDWQGHEGVKLRAIAGEIAQVQAAQARVQAPLPVPMQASPVALEWRLDFATPIAALALVSQRANWLAPVRVLGRDDPAQPWRVLGQTVVFRLGAGAGETNNPPLVLGPVSTRWLRIEASHGMALDAKTMQASVEFQPLRLVFLASGAGPFTLAAGRPQTPSVAMASASFGAALPGDLNQLPAASIAQVDMAPATAGHSLFGQVLPWGIQTRDLALWGALLAGVALLGTVAFSLLHQLEAARDNGAENASQHD